MEPKETESAAPSTMNADDSVSLQRVAEAGKSELLEIIDSIRGRKCLVLDPQLASLLTFLFPEGAKTLKEHGVQYVQEITDSSENDDWGRDIPDHMIYLLRPSLAIVKVLTTRIKRYVSSGFHVQCHMYFAPERTTACEYMLKEEKVESHVKIGDFSMGFLPLDSDLLSLEMPNVFKECMTEGNNTSLDIIAASLHKLQLIYGALPHIKCKGAAARKVLQKMLRLKREEGDVSAPETTLPYAGDSEFDTLVILDREVDLVSPLLTPLTFEGLIDEIFGISSARIQVDAALLGDEDALKVPPVAGQPAPSADVVKRLPGDKAVIPLNNSDVIYKSIRDLSIESIGSILQERALTIKQTYGSFKTNKDASIAEIHDFVKKLPALTKEYKTLSQFINIAEVIKQTTDSSAFREHWQCERGVLEGEPMVDHIEEMILADVEKFEFHRILRLLCLVSLICNGIRTSRLDQVRRLIIQMYGFQHMMTLANLEKCGLLKRKETSILDTGTASSQWIALRKHLRLINDRVNVMSRDDIAYVTAGYAPMSVRLIQLIVRPGWNVNSSVEIMKQLPGPTIEYSQSEKVEERNLYEEMLAEESKQKKNMLVVVIGGLSYIEIAAMRKISQDASFPYNIVMASTNITKGDAFMKALMPSE